MADWSIYWYWYGDIMSVEFVFFGENQVVNVIIREGTTGRTKALQRPKGVFFVFCVWSKKYNTCTVIVMSDNYLHYNSDQYNAQFVSSTYIPRAMWRVWTSWKLLSQQMLWATFLDLLLSVAEPSDRLNRQIYRQPVHTVVIFNIDFVRFLSTLCQKRNYEYLMNLGFGSNTRVPPYH